jgi:hypothetical protein
MRIAVPPTKDPTYKPLRMSFRSKGFDYRQTERIGDVAMFEQTKPGLSRTWFEVVMVRRHDGYTIGDAKVEPSETMPSASQWGKFGWTYRDLKEARSRFDELARKVNV